MSWHGRPGSPRLHIVTGKGGTGKTTAAAALATALAGRGQRVLLIETEERQGISQVLDVAPLGTTEQEVAGGLDGGQVWGLSVEAGAALVEYLRLFYRLGRAGDLLHRLGAIEFATTIAPGVRDVLIGGKVYEAVRRPASGRTPRSRRGQRAEPPAYAAVVLDAPPTGRVGRFLDVTGQLADLARVGPIRQQAEAIRALLHSETTVLHLVTLLEQLPVQETLEALGELRADGLHIGALLVNQAPDPGLQESVQVLAAQTPQTDRLSEQLATVGIRTSPAMLRALALTADEAVARRDRQVRLEQDLVATGHPVLCLPQLPEGVGGDAVRRLAAELAAQGVTPTADQPGGGQEGPDD